MATASETSAVVFRRDQRGGSAVGHSFGDGAAYSGERDCAAWFHASFRGSGALAFCSGANIVFGDASTGTSPGCRWCLGQLRVLGPAFVRVG